MAYRIELKDAYKNYTVDQDKILTPEETVRRFRERLKEVNLDVLEGTMRVDQGRLDIPVYFSLCGKDALEVIGTKKQMGKGGTVAQSEASAVMELAERFSFFSFCKDPRNFITEQYRNLNGRGLPLERIAQSVHDDSDDVEKAEALFSALPMRWTRAYNMTRQEEVLIPFDWFYAINEFNGPSAGNCAEEALVQGICEIVERHVSSLVSRNRIKTPSIRLDSVTDPLAVDIIRKFRNAGVRLFATDFSLDTGIPSVGVLAYDPATFPARSEIVWTAGTSPSPTKALLRAMTEVAQLAGDFNTSSNYVASGLPKFNSLEEARFVTEAERAIPIEALPDLSNPNIRIEVENCVSALSKRGMDVLAVDVMHAGLRIPAFYTIVPGAHFRERAAGTSMGMFMAKLISQGDDHAVALARLKEMDRILPGKYYVKFFLGVTSLSMQDPGAGLDYLRDALSLDPKEEDIPSIYVYMGLCLKEQERFREAIALLEKAGAGDPGRTDVFNLLGYCYFKLREHEKAIECFREVLKLNPSSAIDYANIASNYRDLGKPKEAASYYRLALELDPGIEFARENLDKLLFLLGEKIEHR
ncbi:MAG: tetratricopeptide repeat protein [Desulfobacteraceae bacterium]|nr:MAG: tetratricopeptide repeat protein [Desulfobacteraceae bacterium]